MKIGIVGGGISGMYVANQLSKKNDIAVYERKDYENLGKDCAWMIDFVKFKKYCRKCGLDPSDYVLYPQAKVEVEGFQTLKVHSLVTFDKTRFLHDILRNSSVELKKENIDRENIPLEHDLIIDATGAKRALLPSNSNKNFFIPCYQEKVRSRDLPHHIVVAIKGAGYLWSWPLKDDTFLVGCGSNSYNQKEEVKRYLDDKNHETLELRCGTVKLLPPSKSKPLWMEESDNIVVGVGESIGTISPMTGGGIVPSLKCADYFVRSLKRYNSISKSIKWYCSKVENSYQRSEEEFNLLNSLRNMNPLKMILSIFKLGTAPRPFKDSITKTTFFKGLWSLRDVLPKKDQGWNTR